MISSNFNFILINILFFAFSNTSFEIGYRQKIEGAPGGGMGTTDGSSTPGGSAGTPGGSSRPGGSKPENICPEVEIPLTALIRNQNTDFTIQSNPTFWFYIPYAATDINRMKFTLLDEGGWTTIYETEIQLENNAGFISITLPDNSASSLSVGELYRWNFRLYCQSNSTYEPDRIVNGWIRYIEDPTGVPLIENTYQSLREHNIWYDAISNLATQYSQDPTDMDINAAWQNLLTELGFEDLIGQEPVQFELIPVE